MADEAVVRTVNSYKDLSKDVENHPVLVKDKTMVQFLAYSLSSTDVEVVQLSLDTLDNLMQLEINRQVLRTVFGVSEAMKAASERNDLNETIKHHAARLYEILVLSTPSRKIETNKNSQSADRRKLATHVTTFQIKGLYPETRQELESILVKLRGIVSVVLDVESQRCVVRSLQTVSAQAIADEIAGKTAMVPRLVLRNSQNQEFLQSIIDGDNDDNNDSLPPYLEEEYEPVKENAISSFQTIKTNASSWLNAAASFLQNSLYW